MIKNCLWINFTVFTSKTSNGTYFLHVFRSSTLCLERRLSIILKDTNPFDGKFLSAVLCHCYVPMLSNSTVGNTLLLTFHWLCLIHLRGLTLRSPSRKTGSPYSLSFSISELNMLKNCTTDYNGRICLRFLSTVF